MFTFDQYERGHHRDAVRPTGSFAPLDGVRGRSFLVWGEHCVECAAPDCFSTCDLYQPRPDRRCRRFTYGIHRNPHFQAVRGGGAEVEFRRWGKIESRGNVRLMAPWQLRALEWVVRAGAPVGNVLGRIAGRLSGDIRFHYASYAAAERLVLGLRNGAGRAAAAGVDGFLAEIYNPGAATALMLTISIDRSKAPRGVPFSQLPAGFTKRLELASGYVRHFVPGGDFRAIVESGLPFNVALSPEADNGVRLVFLTLDFVALTDPQRAALGAGSRPAPGRALPKAKCVVFDLDNTLWDGVLLETDDVWLRPGVVELLKALDARGILLSIASKNAHDHAMAKLKAFGIDEYFLYPKINWMPKSQSVRQIAKDLNINADTFVFVDDNPFERDEVTQAVAEVACHDGVNLATLLDDPRLQGSTSAEAAKRRLMYRDEMVRNEIAATYDGGYIDFLRSCGIRLAVRRFSMDDYERAAELVQRTNQLNFSGRHYDRQQIGAVIDDESLEKWLFEVTDKFGSYGVVGFCMVRRDGDLLNVEDFMMSCRVQGKFVEQALFSHLANRHPGGLARRIHVNFVPTDRNAPARQVLDELGFADDPEGGMTLDLAGDPLACDFIAVEADAAPAWPAAALAATGS